MPTQLLPQLLTFLLALCATAVVATPGAAGADTPPVVRVAALKYGTASWELAVIKEQELDARFGFSLEVVPRVSPNASLIALQGGAADFTVSDWLWAAKQRDSGRDYLYFPYSNAVGELLIPASNPAATLSALRGLSVGVAGGASDKSWLLFQTYAREIENVDLLEALSPRYGAPPLLSALATSGELDAVLTYWHYAARLKPEGFRSLLSLGEVLQALGIAGEVPMLGWVFSGDYAQQYPERVNSFLRASYAAKAALMESDASWDSVRPLMRAANDQEFEELRSGYRRGIPMAFGDREIEAVNAVARLVQQSQSELRSGVEQSSVLPGEVFWRGFSIGGQP